MTNYSNHIKNLKHIIHCLRKLFKMRKLTLFNHLSMRMDRIEAPKSMTFNWFQGILSCFLILLTIPMAHGKSSIAPGDICATLGGNDMGGTVWADWNYDGIKNESSLVGVANISVVVYNCDGTELGNTTTNADGDWSLDISSRTTCNGCDDVRVEFHNLPAGYESTFSGTDGGTSVQYIDGPGCGVDMGIAHPSDFCQDNPKIMTNCYIVGRSDDPNTPEDVLVDWNYDQSGTKRILATKSEIGSTWGLAYDRYEDQILTAAF